MVEDETNGFALEYATIRAYVAPQSDAHVLTKAPRPGLVEESVDGVVRYVGEITVSWGLLGRRRDASSLQMGAAETTADGAPPSLDVTFNVPQPKVLTWNCLATDGPQLAPRGDWVGAEPLLDVSAANIDGPPGTGKTSLLRTLISLVVQRHGGDSFLALAPTNVAARNIGEWRKRASRRSPRSNGSGRTPKSVVERR